MDHRSNRIVVPLPTRGSARAFVAFLKDLMETGKFRAVIDRKYPLDAIADAYRYVEAGQKTSRHQRLGRLEKSEPRPHSCPREWE